MVYAAYSKNDEIRKTSSSGGIYRVLAEYILASGGVVFASIYDGLDVCFIEINDDKKLSASQGSKYLPSKLNDTFKIIRKKLQTQSIMFVGLPCQCSGLMTYLGKEYKNLLIVSLVCHGLPSHKAWEAYVSEHKVISINMRDKSKGWNKYCWNIQTQVSNRCIEHTKISYMRGFMNDLYLRPSCYECKFKEEHQGDIILGDFWGIREIDSDMEDDKGTSLVITNTRKGEETFKKICGSCVCKKINNERYKKYNSGFSVAHLTPKRDKFFKLLYNKEFDDIIADLSANSLCAQIKRKILRLANKYLKQY